MFKNTGRRSIGAALSAVMIVGVLSGCGSAGTADADAAGKSINPDVVYRVIDSPLDGIMEAPEEEAEDPGGEIREDGAYIRSIAAAEDRYYVMYEVQAEENEARLCSFDAEGKNVQEMQLPSRENGWISGAAIDADGNILILENLYDEESDSNVWQLASFSPSGDTAENGGGEMTENWAQALEADEDFYARNLVCSEQYIVMLSEEDVRIHSRKDGKELKKTALPAGQFYGGICLDGEGRFIVAGSAAGGTAAWKLDPETGTFTEAKLSAKEFYNFENISSGHSGYDFFGASQDGIFGFMLDGTEPVKIVDFIASDLTVDSVQGCAVLSMDSILIQSFTWSGRGNVELLQKADASSVAEKTILTLGCSYGESNLRKAVVDFNKANDRYRIDIKEYRYDEEGNSRLNAEIAAGNIPDLICVSTDMPVESYASKGLFEDLEPMFASDPDISGNEYMENVLDAFRIDGKMFFVTPDFGVIGLAGRKKDFGDTKGVKISELEKLIRERNLGYDTAIGLADRQSVLFMVMYFAMDQFVDWDNLTCHFDSDSFISLLEFTEKFPKSTNYDNVDWEEYEAMMLEGKQLVRDLYLYDFSTWMRERYGYIGEEVSFMGYLGNGENGPVLQPSMMIAMSHATAEKDACWEFLRTFYLEKYQSDIEFSFPVSKKALQARAEQAMHPRTYTYTDENGEKVTETVGETYYLRGKEVKIPSPQQKDIDEVMRILESAHSRVKIDTNISGIIQEETGAFYAGQKSAAETADIIQSRVSVYIRETK